MIHTFRTMGTVVSLEYAASRREGAAIRRLEEAFDDADERFSLYRPDSELSRINRGELRLMDASDELIDAYQRAVQWRQLTAGAFTAHRPDGVLDLSGIVKALAIAAGGDVLRAAGYTDWCLNAGGDVLLSGTRNRLRPTGVLRTITEDIVPWTVGIIDPFDRGALLAAVVPEPSRSAIATSGSAERGDHIWRSLREDSSGTAAAHFVQVTVAASDIVMADVLATAIVAGGHSALNRLTDRFAVDVLTVDSTGLIFATPGMRAALTHNDRRLLGADV